MSMSLKALREILKDTPPSILPADLAACLAGNKEAIKANHAAYRRWERGNGRELPSPTPRNPQAAATNPTLPLVVANPTPSPATANPAEPQLTPNASPLLPQEATTPPNRPTPRATVQASLTLNSHPSTVHRTDARGAPRNPAQVDLALHLCPNTAVAITVGSSSNWLPQELFPETRTTPPRAVPRAFNKSKTAPSKTLGPDPKPPHRTARFRTRNDSRDTPLLSLQVQDFIDVPLQYTEGRDLLSLIGAASIPLPPHLLNPISKQAPPRETGQPSKTKHKRKKPTSPLAPQPLAIEAAPMEKRSPTLRGQHPPSAFGPSPPLHPDHPPPTSRVDLDSTSAQPLLIASSGLEAVTHPGDGQGEGNPPH